MRGEPEEQPVRAHQCQADPDEVPRRERGGVVARKNKCKEGGRAAKNTAVDGGGTFRETDDRAAAFLQVQARKLGSALEAPEVGHPGVYRADGPRVHAVDKGQGDGVEEGAQAREAAGAPPQRRAAWVGFDNWHVVPLYPLYPRERW